MLSFSRNLFADDAELRSKLDSIVSKDTNATLSIHVLDLNSGREIYQKNGSTLLKPASTLKILSTITALKELGGSFLFSTPFKITSSKQKDSFNVHVKGVGDPFLTTEFLWIAARKIKKYGVNNIDQILIDDSAFVDPPVRQGQRAYMTGASAMSFNFNSLSIEVCPGEAGEKAFVSSDPWEVPVEIISNVKTITSGEGAVEVEESAPSSKNFLTKYVVKGSINFREPCRVISRSMTEPAKYFAYTLEAFLKYLGIKINRGFDFAAYPESEARSFKLPTYPVAHVIKSLNHYSTNFIAEQLLYTLGADEDFKTFDRLRGLKKMEATLEAAGVERGEYSLQDGSGLSHENRVSSSTLTALLAYAYRQDALKSDFIASLPTAGVSGTMKKRTFDTSNAFIRAKTGSLDAVNTLAGYVFTKKQKQYAFAILQNNVKSKDKAWNLEEKIVDTIANN